MMTELEEDDNPPKEVEQYTGCAKACHHISPFIFILICIFSMAAWIDMYGLWVEMPVLVQVLPEAWKLPSYLTIIMKAGNIAPIVYVIINKCCPGNTRRREIILAYIIIIMGAICCLLLAFLWKRTAKVGDVEHSVAFFVLASVLSVVDCTSAIVFLPFMANFRPIYMTAYCIGEGLSGLLPGLVGLIQGAGSDPECRNVSTRANESYHHSTYNASDGSTLYFSMKIVYKEPRFSAEFYFLFLFFMLLFSGAAFTMLIIMPLSAKHQKLTKILKSEREEEMKDMAEKETNQEQPEEDNNVVSETDQESLYDQADVEISKSGSVPSNCHFAFLIFLNLWMCAVFYGLSPALLTYACLPYGNQTYSLTMRLSTCAIPVAALLTFWLRSSSTKLISILTVVSSLLIIYPMYVAIQSPHPPLQDHAGGRALIIIISILCAAVTSYGYTLNHILLQELYGHRGLLFCGATTQLGSFIGGIIIFIFVSVLNVFKSYEYCT